MVRWVLQLDAAMMVGLHRWSSPTVTRAMSALTHLGDATNWTLLGLVLLTTGGRAWGAGIRLGVAAVLATLATQALKRLFRRPRPSAGLSGFRALVENPDLYSFPSGHTSAATAVAVAMAGYGSLTMLLVALACGVGVSRVYLGAHYPADVVAGAVVGLAAGIATQLLMTSGLS